MARSTIEVIVGHGTPARGDRGRTIEILRLPTKADSCNIQRFARSFDTLADLKL
jgi:hypothetical protein